MPNIWNGTVWWSWLSSKRAARVCQHQIRKWYQHVALCIPTTSPPTHPAQVVLVSQQESAPYGAVVPGQHDMCIPVSATSGRTHLRSAVHCDLVVPRTHLARYGPRGFALSGPVTWNSLPTDLRDTSVCCEFLKPTQDWTIHQTAGHITWHHSTFVIDSLLRGGRTLTFLIVLRYILYICTRNSAIATNRARICAVCNGVADCLKLPVCVTTPNRYTLKDANINRGEPKNWGALGLRSLSMGGVANP